MLTASVPFSVKKANSGITCHIRIPFTFVVRTGPMLIIGFTIATFFTGVLPGYFRVLPWGILVILGGFVITNLFRIIIGLLAFRFEEVSPFYRIIQKLVFIIGGMFFPIDFFPEWLQGVSRGAGPRSWHFYSRAICTVFISH